MLHRAPLNSLIIFDYLCSSWSAGSPGQDTGWLVPFLGWIRPSGSSEVAPAEQSRGSLSLNGTDGLDKGCR